jgi:two-component system chemotaxis sensor kinase CheA
VSNEPGGLSPATLASIRNLFFEECEELLAELESGLLAIERGETPEGGEDPLNAVFRAVHSIKGGAAAFELSRLIRFAHQFESTLAAVRSGLLPMSADLVRLSLRAADVLADLVRAEASGAATDLEREAEIAEALAELTPAEGDDGDLLDLEFTPVPIDAPDQAPTRREWAVRFRPESELYARAGEPLLLLRELAGLGTFKAELDDAELPTLAELEPEKSYLGWTVRLETAEPEAVIRSVFAFVEGDCEVTVCPEGETPTQSVRAGPEPREPGSPAAPQPPGQTIRVDLERVDRLINLVGEILINQAMLAQRLADAGLGRVAGAEQPLDELERLTRETQDSVMAIRAQPVKVVLQRMSRLVRELEGATGKQADLVLSGESTEVDRTVIERLTYPLTHMIRNAIDHGLETPERRVAAGKPARGVLRISPAHRAGRQMIEVSDDGAGIDRPRVRATAIDRGLIDPAAELTDADLDALIFAAGFSTQTVASDLSGRGVGMDVVRQGVEALGGRITVSSRPGQGCTFTLSLPLTLAVLDGMVVSVAGAPYVTPLTTLVEAVRPRAGDLRYLGPDALLLSVRGVQLPVIDLGRLFQLRATPMDPDHCIALVVEDDRGGQAALLVDEILGQRQVVIRNLDANYQAVAGVESATILGDGRVALILDVDSILASQRRDQTLAERRIA